jgi:hypothetical protein
MWMGDVNVSAVLLPANRGTLMITKEKIAELHQLMLSSKVINDKAIVEITAAELEQLLDIVKDVQQYYHDHTHVPGKVCPPGVACSTIICQTAGRPWKESQ